MSPNRITGTISIPRITLPTFFDNASELGNGDFIVANFTMNRESLVFKTDDPRFAPLFLGYTKIKAIKTIDAPEILCDFLKFVTGNDALMLSGYRDHLHSLEALACGPMNDIPDDFDEYIFGIRQKIYELERFYRQLVEMGRVLSTSRVPALSKESRKLFALLYERANRLVAESKDVSDYAMNIPMLRQSRVGAQQAEVAQVLTIVATIFMSVSLITGWYGMNFETMPELHNEFSYLICIIICCVVVIVEFVVFKRMKWF